MCLSPLKAFPNRVSFFLPGFRETLFLPGFPPPEFPSQDMYRTTGSPLDFCYQVFPFPTRVCAANIFLYQAFLGRASPTGFPSEDFSAKVSPNQAFLCYHCLLHPPSPRYQVNSSLRFHLVDGDKVCLDGVFVQGVEPPLPPIARHHTHFYLWSNRAGSSTRGNKQHQGHGGHRGIKRQPGDRGYMIKQEDPGGKRQPWDRGYMDQAATTAGKRE